MVIKKIKDRLNNLTPELKEYAINLAKNINKEQIKRDKEKVEERITRGSKDPYNIGKKFNYCVGHYWEGSEGSIGCYAYGSEHFYGTEEDAKEFLEYVKEQSPDHKWKIFKVVEL